jgi:hypothetical protein
MEVRLLQQERLRYPLVPASAQTSTKLWIASSVPYGASLTSGHQLAAIEEARAALAECERLSPGFLTRRADWRPYPDMKRNQLVFAGLKRLGLS